MPRLPRLLRFGCQNVRSLLDLSNAGAGAPPRRSAVCDDEFSRVQTEVIALSESRLPNKGNHLDVELQRNRANSALTDISAISTAFASVKLTLVKVIIFCTASSFIPQIRRSLSASSNTIPKLQSFPGFVEYLLQHVATCSFGPH
ncbi:hypothetical protein EMCRGX_G017169 [Ephydatia muelleri]